MSPMLSRLLGIIAALAAFALCVWFAIGFTWVNGSPVALFDPWWLLVAVALLAIVGTIIYWTNWRRPR